MSASDGSAERQLDYLAAQITRMEPAMIDPREFGHLEEQVRSLARKVDGVERKVDGIDSKVDGLHDTMTEARGGWRAVAWVGGVAATLGAGLAWAVQHLTLRP